MFILLIILLTSAQILDQFLSLSTTELRQLSPKDLFNYLSSGNLQDGYLSETQLKSLMDKLTDQYSQFVSTQFLTLTNRSNRIKSLTVKISEKPRYQVIIVGLLHGNQDLISINFIMLQLYQLVIRLNQGDPYAQRLFADKELNVIVALNVDAYQYINNYYSKFNYIPTIYKNRHATSSTCNEEQDGVDIQRNFIYKFAQDSYGSSNYPCDQFYRGPYALSEPESQAIQLLVQQQRPDLMLVVGGDGENIVHTLGISNNFKALIDKISNKYSLAQGTYDQIYTKTINGDLCTSYAYSINTKCLMLNLGSSNSNITQTLDQYFLLLVDILKLSSASLNLSIGTSESCLNGKKLCKTLQKNEKGFEIELSIFNHGFETFNSELDLEICLTQNGEKLYTVYSYSLLNDTELYGATIKLQSEFYGSYEKSKIGEILTINAQSSIKLIVLLKQINFQYNYINTVKQIDIQFNLLNSLEDQTQSLTIKTDQFKAIQQNKQLSAFVRNRPESYILLILFGFITFGFINTSLIRRICIYFKKRKLIQQQHNNDLNLDEKIHFEHHEINPKSLVESRLHSQIKETQVAPSDRLERESPPQHSSSISRFNNQQTEQIIAPFQTQKEQIN